MDIETLSIAFDLDGGGYAFETAEDVFTEALASGEVTNGELYRLYSELVFWDDPDDDYLGTGVRWGQYSCALFAFCPGNDGFDFPPTMPGPFEDSVRVLVKRGVLASSPMHECMCHGHYEDGVWTFDGDPSQPAWDNCDRCGGSGAIPTPGGAWAAYALKE